MANAEVSAPEVWRAVAGYEGRYEVSSLGRVRVLRKRGFLYLKASPNRHGYPSVTLWNGKTKSVRVHRLVAEAFIPNPEHRPFVNHVDANKTNNSIGNLEWVTPAENSAHAAKLGRLKTLRGEACNTARLSAKQVRDIRRKGLSKSAGELAKAYGVTHTNIRDILNGKIWKGEGEPPGCAPATPPRAVKQLGAEGEVIAVFSSAKEAARSTGFDNRNISACLNGRRKTYQGYRWTDAN